LSSAWHGVEEAGGVVVDAAEQLGGAALDTAEQLGGAAKHGLASAVDWLT